MVIKGYIVSIPEPGDNHFQVRIPFIEDNTGVEIIMTALLCSQPGVYGGYDIGDCVFVSFEGDKHMDDDVITDTPVIIGKLYQDEVTGVHNNCIIESLAVSSKAELPSNTTFGGQSASDIFDLIQNVNVINNSLKELEEKVEEIEQDAEIDGDAVKSIRKELDEFKDKVDSEIEEIEEKLSNIPTEEEIQEIISEVSDLATEIEELSSEIIGLSSTINNLSETVDGIIGNYVDLSTNQVIDGQKDFEVVPRIYVDPEGTSHNLPSGYDELLYLANTGEQYIDCNYTPTANSNIVFDMEVGCTRQTGRRNFLCCCGTTSYGHYCEILPNGYFGTRINNVDYVTNVYAQPNQKYNVIMTKTANGGNSISVTVGESTVTCTVAQSTTVLSPIYLFRLASGYTGESIIFYSCKIYVNNTLIREMYPCERTSDNTLGMYDKVNDVFYSNAGGGQFISGGSINPHYESVLTSSGLSEVAYTGEYNSLYGTPVIPTVNNPLITIKQGTINKGTFNLNQSSAKTITLDGINDLLKQVSGYDGTVSQTLKHNANGVIQWVND